jgi:hypothetical protein
MNISVEAAYSKIGVETPQPTSRINTKHTVKRKIPNTYVWYLSVESVGICTGEIFLDFLESQR